MNDANEERVLAKNVKVELKVPVEDVWHFRPRRGEDGRECATIELSPTSKGGPYTARIYDEREDSVFISRGMANIRTAEKAAKSLLNQEKVGKAKTEAHTNWDEYFALNASVHLDYEEASPGRKQPVLVLRDPEESEEEGLLTTITFDKGPGASFSIRNPGDGWCRIVIARGKKDEQINHFLLLTVTSKESPINIFHRIIDHEKLVATDYILTDRRRIVRREATITKEEWLEGEPVPEAVASFEEEVPEPSDEQSTLKPEEPSKPPKKKRESKEEPSTDEDSLTSVLGLKDKEIEKLEKAGIKTREDFLEKAGEKGKNLGSLATATGISKSRLTKAYDRVKPINGHNHNKTR